MLKYLIILTMLFPFLIIDPEIDLDGAGVVGPQQKSVEIDPDEALPHYLNVLMRGWFIVVDTPTKTADDKVVIKVMDVNGNSTEMTVPISCTNGMSPKKKAQKYAAMINSISGQNGDPVDAASSNSMVVVTENGDNIITGLSVDNKSGQKDNMVEKVDKEKTATLAAAIRLSGQITGIDGNGEKSQIKIGFNGSTYEIGLLENDPLDIPLFALYTWLDDQNIDAWVGADPDNGYWLIFNVPSKKTNMYIGDIHFGMTDNGLNQIIFTLEEDQYYPGQEVHVWGYDVTIL